MELKAITAIITGSSGRLGGAIAEALAQNRCNCICHYHRNKLSAQTVARRIEKSGGKALTVQADLTKAGQIEKIFDAADQFGTPQVLINSAATFAKQPLDKITFEKTQQILNLNLTAPILTSQAFAKRIKDKFGDKPEVVGKIINISDVGAILGWAKSIVYCSSKAGLIGATKSLAKELAPAICVNSIAPGLVTWPEEFDESEKKRQLSFIPTGKIGQLGDITNAVIFLLENDYITGQVLNVDGGRCI